VPGVGAPAEPRPRGRPAGLSLLNISLDTLRPERFERMTRRRGHERVMAAILRAVELGYDPVKARGGFAARALWEPASEPSRVWGAVTKWPNPIAHVGVVAECSTPSRMWAWWPSTLTLSRMWMRWPCAAPRGVGASRRLTPRRAAQINVVVMRGANCDELGDFAALGADLPVNVRFIEYMPFDGNVWSDAKMVPFREMRAAMEARFPQGLERLQARARAGPQVGMGLGPRCRQSLLGFFLGAGYLPHWPAEDHCVTTP
jgi:hypothetical protein